MAEISRGPAISAGALVGGVVTSAGARVAAVEPTDGPSLFYQGACFPDVRYGPFDKDGLAAGRMPAFLDNPSTVLVDAIPSASSASPADVAAAQNVASGTAMQLANNAANPSAGASGQCAHMVNAPLVPFGGSTPITVPVALDMGFAFGTFTAGDASVTVADSSLFAPGQWLVLGGGGNPGNTAPLLAQVTSVPDATHVRVSPSPSGSMTRAPLASANAYFSPAGGFPFGVKATAVRPYLAAGAARLLNPAEGVARALGITGSPGATGGSFLVAGYDFFGLPMTESILHTGGALVLYGAKCWKYVLRVTPQFSDAHDYSVGVGDTLGFHLRSDRWEHVTAFVAGAPLTASTGWLAASPVAATATTADQRGSIQVGTRGAEGAGAAGGPLDGAKRIALGLQVPLRSLLGATPENSAAMFGGAPALGGVAPGGSGRLDFSTPDDSGLLPLL